MIPGLPKAKGKTVMVLTAATWNAIRSQLIASSAQAGFCLKEGGGGAGGTKFDVDVHALLVAVGKAGKSGNLYLVEGGAEWDDGSGRVAVDHLVFKDGLLTNVVT